MTSIKLMLNKDRVLKSGKYPLVFQIIHARKKKLIYTNIQLLESEFDSGKEKVRYSKKSKLPYRIISLYNQEVMETKMSIVKLVDNLESKQKCFTVSDIVDNYRMKSKAQPLLLSPYMLEQVEKKKHMARNGTAAAYLSTQHSVQKFIGDKMIRFIDIDFKFLDDYMTFLLANGNAPNTIAYYIRNFRTMYNRACKEGAKVVPVNPFKEITIKMDKTVKRALTKNEIRQIAALDLSGNPKRELARDLFMFSYNTRGMPLVDVLELKKEDIVEDIIFYRRAKTNQPLQVALTTAIIRLVEKYKNDGEYVFPVLDPDKKTTLYNQYRNALKAINKELKGIAKDAGIKMKITTYSARHTWASEAKKTGAPISYISDALGHNSELTTQIYLTELDTATLGQLNEQVTAL